MWLYILKERRRFRYKIGITKTLRTRIKQIPVPCRLIFAFPMLRAAKVEKWLHNRYKHLNRPKQSGSGRTEWFYFWLPVRPFFWGLVWWVLEWGMVGAIILLLIWM